MKGLMIMTAVLSLSTTLCGQEITRLTKLLPMWQESENIFYHPTPNENSITTHLLLSRFSAFFMLDLNHPNYTNRVESVPDLDSVMRYVMDLLQFLQEFGKRLLKKGENQQPFSCLAQSSYSATDFEDLQDFATF
jgi:hypothetical protein